MCVCCCHRHAVTYGLMLDACAGRYRWCWRRQRRCLRYAAVSNDGPAAADDCQPPDVQVTVSCRHRLCGAGGGGGSEGGGQGRCLQTPASVCRYMWLVSRLMVGLWLVRQPLQRLMYAPLYIANVRTYDDVTVILLIILQRWTLQCKCGSDSHNWLSYHVRRGSFALLPRL